MKRTIKSYAVKEQSKWHFIGYVEILCVDCSHRKLQNLVWNN